MKLTLVIVALLMLCISAYAHPASEIYAKYTAGTKTLSISYDHVVKNPTDHYIQGVEIRLNDKMIISQVSTAQDSVNGGEFVYRIPNLKLKDVLDITLICNKVGKKTTKLILGN